MDSSNNEENEEKQVNSLEKTLESMKPMMNDFMKLLQKNVNQVQKEQDSDSNNSNSNNSESEETPEPLLNNTMNSVFDMLGPLLKGMDKHKDNKPYLGMMPYTFNMLSHLQSEEAEAVEVQNNSSLICTLLKDKEIDQLYEVPEFKKAVLNVTVNLNKMIINQLKKQVETFENDLLGFTEETSTDVLLENIYNRFGKK